MVKQMTRTKPVIFTAIVAVLMVLTAIITAVPIRLATAEANVPTVKVSTRGEELTIDG